METTRALFIGRFQPFHLGHLKAIKYILEENNEIIIVIGSTQYSHSERDPLTAGERLFMITKTLISENIDPKRFYIAQVPDVNNNVVWAVLICSMVPSFHVMYSNNTLVKRLFSELGYEVKSIPFFDRDNLSATNIRDKMWKGEKWKRLVPKTIERFIYELKVIDRIKEILANSRG